VTRRGAAARALQTCLLAAAPCGRAAAAKRRGGRGRDGGRHVERPVSRWCGPGEPV